MTKHSHRTEAMLIKETTRWICRGTNSSHALDEYTRFVLTSTERGVEGTVVLTHDTGIHQGCEDDEDVRKPIAVHITQLQWG